MYAISVIPLTDAIPDRGIRQAWPWFADDAPAAGSLSVGCVKGGLVFVKFGPAYGYLVNPSRS